MIPILIGTAAMFAFLLSPRQETPLPDVVLDWGPDASLKRVRLKANRSYVEQTSPYDQKGLLRDVAARLETMGWGPVLLVTQDPTDRTSFSVLTRGKGQASGGALTLMSLEPVDEPFGQNKLADPSPDPGLLTDEVKAIEHALLTETNPRHLTGFAGTFEPHFPVASSLLRAKARLLEAREILDGHTTLAMMCEASSFAPRTRSMWQTLVSEKGPRPPRAGLLKSPEINPSEQAHGLMRVRAYADYEGIPRDLILSEVMRGACFACEKFDEGIKTLPPVVRKLSSSLIKTSPDCSVVDGKSVRDVCPPRGDEGFISPSALQLALAEGKPVMSGVRTPGKVPYLLDSISRDSDNKDVQGMRARAMMEKAERAIERRRWIEWYRNK